MYHIKKRMEIAGCHSLDLPYESKCRNLHGHNWIIEVCLSSRVLNDERMVCDFTKIKDIVMDYDHANLNELLPGNPTAESLAAFIYQHLSIVTSENVTVEYVSVQESEGNTAWFYRDNSSMI